MSIAAMLFAVLAVTSSSAQAGKLTVLHSFCREGGCHSSSGSFGGLLRDAAGNLYGTQTYDGAHGGGYVYMITASEDYRILYEFVNGAMPMGPPIIDANGNLYVTFGGTKFGKGAVYQLSPPTSGSRWTLHQLYEFNACDNGCHPMGGLTYAGQQAGAPYDGTSSL